MLRAQLLRVRPRSVLAPLSVRGYASQSQSNKIVVVPFKQGPEAARERLLLHGLLGTGHWSNVLFAGILRFFGTAAEPFAREFGLGESVVLRDMKAVYYPVWRMDVMAEGSASVKTGDESTGWLAVREGYVPGNAFAPLSYISYAVPPLPTDLEVYEPAKHLKQLDGAEIVPVPFDVSPFAFIEKIRRKIGNNTNLGGVRINADDWKETMVAAYPILFPIYIAEFEYTVSDGEKKAFSVIMDAHSEKILSCRVTFPPPDEMRDSGRVAPNYYVNPATFLPSANLILPVLGERVVMGTAPAASIMAKSYLHWMSPEPTGDTIPASPTYSVAGEPIPWSDPRVIQWGSEAHDENGEYLESALEVYRNIEALHAMTAISDSLPEGGTVNVAKYERGSGITREKKPLSAVHADIQKNIDAQKRELDALKPRWLKEYEKSDGKK